MSLSLQEIVASWPTALNPRKRAEHLLQALIDTGEVISSEAAARILKRGTYDINWRRDLEEVARRIKNNDRTLDEFIDFAPPEPGGDLILHLCDGGGIWEHHNDWLVDRPSPTRLRVSGETASWFRGATHVALFHGTDHVRNGQWTVTPTVAELYKRTGRTGTPSHRNYLRLAVTVEA